MEYEMLEPFGAWRDNFHTGVVASILANVFKAKNRQAATVSDFMYRDPQQARDDHDAALLSELRARKKH